MSLFYETVEILACLLYYIYTFCVIGIFFRKSSFYRIWILIVSGMFYLPLTAVEYEHISNTAMSLASMLVVFIVSLVCYQGHPAKKLLTIVIFNIFDILLGNILFFLISNITGSPIPELAAGRNSTRVYLLCTNYFIEFVLIYLLKRIRISSQRLKRTESAISFIFFLCDFTVCILTFYVLFCLKQNKTIRTICFVLSGLMLATTLLVLYLLRQLQYQHQRELENKMLSVQILEQQQLLAQVQQNVEQIQNIQHDMKNYLLQYKLLLEEGKVPEVLDDLEKMLGKRISSKDFSYTKHPLINALLKYKCDTANKLHIPFHVRVRIDPEYQNLDLMVALSNLIDNAIEAESDIPEQFRAVSVEIVGQNNHLSILIQNKITSSVLAVNPDLTSSKREGIHGIGLKNVKRIIEAQDGLIDIFEENENFCVHIFYP